MPDEVHVHQTEPRGDGGGPGWIIALVAVVLLVGVIWFGFMRGDGQRGVPDRIEVDVNAPGTGGGTGGGGTGGGGTGGGGTGGGSL